MKIGSKINEDKFKTQFGQRFTNELEIYFANSNLSQHDKMVLIDLIERAFELGKTEIKMLKH